MGEGIPPIQESRAASDSRSGPARRGEPSLTGSGSARHNLPARLTSFVGREREVSEIRSLLDTARLVSLTGPGGSGKTRLSIEIASAVLPLFPDGAWFVELAPLVQSELVVQAVAEPFEVREQPEVPLIELVVRHLADRRLLLIVDNCEHLIDAVAEVVQALMSGCPDMRIVATSREPLRVPGESVFRVPPLDVPDLEGSGVQDVPTGYASVRLFGERARAASGSFALTADNAATVAQLCARLDGMPLAIELAATRVSMFPVATILERLDDRFRLLIGGSRTALSRHQTLQATLDWSYDLLDVEERELLCSLSVFLGGISIDALEGICGSLPNVSDPVEVLSRLVDKSLVIPDDAGTEPRYRLLETVREYGRERIDRSGNRGALEDQHADWFAEFVVEAEKELLAPRADSRLSGQELEQDNIGAALDRSLLSDPTRALRIAASMWGFWLWRGYLGEGRRWLDLALAGTSGQTEVRAEALLGAAVLTIRSGRRQAGIEMAKQSLEMFRELGNERAVCRVLHVLGPPIFAGDRFVEAERVYRESLDVAAGADFGPGRAAAMHGLGIIRWYRGYQGEALGLLRESLTLFRSLGDTLETAPAGLDIVDFLVREPATDSVRIVFEERHTTFRDVFCRSAAGYVLANLGMIARLEGDHAGARYSLEEALALFVTLGDHRGIGHTLGRLGSLAIDDGDHALARQMLERSLEVRTRIRDWSGVTLSEVNLGNLAIAEGDYDRAADLLERSAETFKGQRGDKFGYGATLGHLASLALARGDQREARRRLEEMRSLAGEIGRTRWTAWATFQLAALSRFEGEDERAEALIEEALALFREIEDPRGIEQCLAFRAGSSRRILASVLFVDIVDSTQRAADIGDRRWRELLATFQRLVREKLPDFGGREVDTAGDGFLTAFESPAQAIACALSIAAGSGRVGLKLRAGIHTGECEPVGQALRGIAVHIGSRVASLAAPGELLVTGTVKDLVMGSGIELEERGIHALRGVPGEWPLFAVRAPHRTEGMGGDDDAHER